MCDSCLYELQLFGKKTETIESERERDRTEKKEGRKERKKDQQQWRIK